MKMLTAVLSVLVFSSVASAQNPDRSKWMCRNLSESGNYLYEGETIFGSQACRPIPQAASVAPAPPAPKQDSGTTTPVASSSNSIAIRDTTSVPAPAQPAPASAPANIDASAQAEKGTVTFATILENGTVQPLMPNWAIKWVKKNQKKYPDVHFQTSGNAVPGGKNFLVVFSVSSRVLQGFQPVTHTDISTSTGQVSGSGTVTSNYGDTWNYDTTGTVNSTTTTTVHENAAYTQNTNILYVTAYDEKGVMVAQQAHVYSTQAGGDASYAAGYNLGNAIRAINAHGRTLGWVIDRIEGKKQ